MTEFVFNFLRSLDVMLYSGFKTVQRVQFFGNIVMQDKAFKNGPLACLNRKWSV